MAAKLALTANLGRLHDKQNEHLGAKNISQLDFPSDLIAGIKGSDQKSTAYERDGKTVHINIRYINEFQWCLVVEQDESRTTRRIFSVLVANIFICAAATAVVLILMFAIFKTYQNKLETLRGIVPICAICKKIRDDKGYWNQLEAYISEHTDAQFSHGYCPKCMKEHYPEYYKKDEDAEKRT